MSSQLKVVFTVNDNAVTTGNKLNINGTSQGFRGLAEWCDRIASGSISARARIEIGPTKANNQITFASFVADDTVTINGNILTGKASPSGANQFAVGSDDFDVANNIVAKINASALGKIQNTVYAYRKATVAFSSFATTNYVTVNGIVLTGKTTPSGDREFKIGGSNTTTCQNFVKCINSLKSTIPALQPIRTVTEATGTATILCDGTLKAAISANGTVAAKFVVLEAIPGGTIGNLFTLAISAHGSVTGANFANGADGTFIDLKKGILV